jgi:hypothetical protein
LEVPVSTGLLADALFLPFVPSEKEDAFNFKDYFVQRSCYFRRDLEQFVHLELSDKLLTSC